ncbi:isocitrate lyase/phosphoenolpyruvate mutase family protein [Saccharothrix sp.]|uniref:isocitrate lyase/phosphoenolpyruvate mutase family protein n=1 Tax=Saccharothrix sp. TaxID=1873460 RepID=UPI00281153CF|nr:isocitrate lyase/phosphoenolpyruvate mutase family protein [Saccharothrix sp.]
MSQQDQAELFRDLHTGPVLVLPNAWDAASARLVEHAGAEAFLAAGADGVFVPGVADPDTIAALARGIDVPLNVMAGPGSPSVAELAGLGVARVSVGQGIAEAAYGVALESARRVLADDGYPAGAVDYGLMNSLLTTPGA